MPNREWREEWGGETVIKLDGEWKKFIRFRTCFLLFKGNIPNHGLPNDNYKGLRATLVYKPVSAQPIKNPPILGERNGARCG